MAQTSAFVPKLVHFTTILLILGTMNNIFSTYFVCCLLQEVCQPCKIKYDFIAKVETLADDLEILLPKMKASQFVGHFSKRPMMTYGYMYQNVSKSLLEAVKVKYKADAELFGYDMNKYDNMVNNNL